MSRRRPKFKVLLTLIISFLAYILITGFFLFLVQRPLPPGSDPERFYSDTLGPDRALIIEERPFAAEVRLDLVQRANSSIRLAYYAVHDGLSGDIFYATLLEAAERGVEIELLFDGIFHNLKGRERSTYWALVNHPNIRVKFFEPLNILKPWTFNNRLHDKFIVVDETYLLLGGRNIGDKYFLESYTGQFVEDRDVLILNTNRDNLEESVLGEFVTYFDHLWNHKYSVERDPILPKHRLGRALERQEELTETLKESKREHPTPFNNHYDWEALTLPTNKVTLLANPVVRLNKPATILAELVALAETAQESLLFQSPYIIPDRHMRNYLREEWPADLYLLTNSTYSSPNFFAISGYLKHRDKLARQATTLYEYYGEETIHAKSYIFDQRLSIIGSFNLDPRSAFLSTESVVVIDSPLVAEALSDNIVKLIEESAPYPSSESPPKKAPFNKRLLIGIVSILLYPFDPLL